MNAVTGQLPEVYPSSFLFRHPRLFTMWEWCMEIFSGPDLFNAISLLGRLRSSAERNIPGGHGTVTAFSETNAGVPTEERLKMEQALRFVESTFKGSGLETSAEAVNEFRTALLNYRHESFAGLTEKDVVSRIDEIERTVRREMKKIVFMCVPAADSQWAQNPKKDWESVIERFPKVQIDVEESSYCMAYSRYGAAVFHVLLVAEFGVIEVARRVGVAGDKPGWSALDRIDKVLKKPYNERSIQEQQHSALLEQIQPLMLSMKNSWRHKISHVENKLEWLDTDFSPQTAKEIIVAVRGFMRHLASAI